MNIVNNFKIDNYDSNIIDTGVTISDTDYEGFLVETLGLGTLLVKSNYTADNGTALASLKEKSMYNENVNASIILTSNDGFCYGVTGFTGGDLIIQGNGFLNISASYTKTRLPTDGSLYFSMNSTTGYASTSYMNIASYTNGSVIRISNSAFNCYFATCDGALYCINAHTRGVKVGYLRKQSTVFFSSGYTMNKNKLYTITPSIFNMTGIVSNYYGEAVSGIKIVIYNKMTHRMIGVTVSGDGGLYDIDVMGKMGDECYMVFLAPPDVNFQSKVVDTVILQ